MLGETLSPNKEPQRRGPPHAAIRRGMRPTSGPSSPARAVSPGNFLDDDLDPVEVTRSPYAVRAELRRGRGAVSNQSGRYEALAHVEADESFAYDDGWNGADNMPPPIRTTVTIDSSRTILARNTSPDIPFDRSINPYRGCENGCSYCFARPSHAQLGYSPGLDFETKLVAKPEAALQLRAELAKKNYRPAPIALGTNTDPYQPIEKGLRITREILETLIDCKHPFTIVTKSALVARDIDILAAAAKENLVSVHLSVTTIDRKLSRMMEPRASRPSKRLETIRALSRAGIPVGVMAAPMIPGLTDMELESILEAAATAGAVSAGYLLLRLPLEIKALFTEWLEENVPDRASRVLKLMREAYGGKLYDSEFGLRGVGSGPFAELLGERFRLSAARLGLKGKTHQLDSSKFEAPTAPKKPSPQLDLF